MRIEIRGRGVEVGSGIRKMVERRARFALGRRSDPIDRVQVWLEDVNGPKGGTDKRCRARLVGDGLGGRVVEAQGGDLGAVIFEAFERASRLVHRLLGRMHEHALGTTRPWLARS